MKPDQAAHRVVRPLRHAVAVGLLLASAGTLALPEAAWASEDTGAASVAPAAVPAARAAGTADPLERLNRNIFLFNGVLDHFLIKPVAEAYEAVVPKPVRTGVGNVLGNVGDAWSAVNLVLQGKGTRAVEMSMRVTINTVIGLGGVLDVATEAGLERQTEDFGQTLATWGVPTGPYLVLPLFGPSTARDASGFLLDQAYTSAVYTSREPQRWRWLGIRLTDARTDALPFTRMLDTVALDKYVFVRDAYLSRRRSQVYDGNPPPEPDDQEPVEGAEPTRP